MRCPEEVEIKAAYQYLGYVIAICGSHLFFHLLSFITWFQKKKKKKAKGPTVSLSWPQPYPTQRTVWKMGFEKASRNAPGHVKSESERTQV